MSRTNDQCWVLSASRALLCRPQLTRNDNYFGPCRCHPSPSIYTPTFKIGPIQTLSLCLISITSIIISISDFPLNQNIGLFSSPALIYLLFASYLLSTVSFPLFNFFFNSQDCYVYIHSLPRFLPSSHCIPLTIHHLSVRTSHVSPLPTYLIYSFPLSSLPSPTPAHPAPLRASRTGEFSAPLRGLSRGRLLRCWSSWSWSWSWMGLWTGFWVWAWGVGWGLGRGCGAPCLLLGVLLIGLVLIFCCVWWEEEGEG